MVLGSNSSLPSNNKSNGFGVDALSALWNISVFNFKLMHRRHISITIDCLVKLAPCRQAAGAASFGAREKTSDDREGGHYSNIDLIFYMILVLLSHKSYMQLLYFFFVPNCCQDGEE